MRLACVLLPIASAFLGPTQRSQAPLRATTDDETAPPLLKIPIPGSATATLEHGIENLLRHYIPSVTEVRAVM